MSRYSEYAIEVNNLCWSFGERKILENINLKFEKGRFYSIIGPNGSGKTTLLRNITGALRPGKNSVLIEGRDSTLIRARELSRIMACVYQNPGSDLDFSVMDVVLMGRTPYLGRLQTEGREDIEVSQRAMEVTNTLYLKDKKINEISGGEKQRVMVARAIAQNTEILLLDEPTSNLDIYHQMEILDTVKNLNLKRGVTVIAVLHDLNLAAQYSDCLILMRGGKIVACDEPERALTGENIRNVYNIEFDIIKNPVNGRPHIIPVSNRLKKVQLGEVASC